MERKPTEDDLQLQDALNKLNGKLVHITKEVNRDIDETALTLSGANLHERPKTIDGYVSPYVLQLHGKGRIGTDNAQYREIPYETYEIPLTNKLHTHVQPNHISIKTEDGTYTIKHH
ncbi:MAG TPA: hypothetical protein GX497_14455 [Bacillus bacterium]|nr:hypothetical protein [Bacillus sp. (in: firmicutes)]